MAECWRPIPGYEGIYEISNLAGIRTWMTRKGFPSRRVKSDRPVLLNPMLCYKRKKGVYELDINLYKDGKRKRYMVKHLMRDVWMQGKKPGLVVRCKDGDQSQCALHNLEYTTMKKLCQSKEKRSGNRVPVLKLDAKTKEVLEIYPSIAQAARKNYLSERALTFRMQNKTVIDGVLFRRDR